MNAWLPIYNSDYATRETDNGASCIESNQRPVFASSSVRGTRNCVISYTRPAGNVKAPETSRAVGIQEGGFYGCIGGNDSLIDPSKLRVATRQQFNKYEIGTVSSFDFSAVATAKRPRHSRSNCYKYRYTRLSISRVLKALIFGLSIEGAAVSSELSFTVFEACTL